MELRWQLFIIISLISYTTEVSGALRRCYTCRSRGDLGTCKDPFKVNATLVEKERGVETVPCATGWCAKILEGGSSFSDSDYGAATERTCLSRGPSDSEERCALTLWNHKKVYICFCKGDLCNASSNLYPTCTVLLATISYLAYLNF